MLKHYLSIDNPSRKPIESYEHALKQYFDAKFCLAVSSGTAALQVALYALDIAQNKVVAIAPTAPLCSVYPILNAAAEPYFTDIQHDNFGLELALLADVSNKYDAILEVPMWGYPFEADKTKSFAENHNKPLIFDLAHCAGTTYKGKSLSKYCDVACFSTQKNKMFSTGEGGYILTDSEEIYDKARMFSRLGELNGVDFGVNYKLSPLLAKIGEVGLQGLDDSINRRKQKRNYILDQLKNPNLKEYAAYNYGKANYQRFLVQSINGQTGLAEHLLADGIETDKIKYNIKPLYEHEILKKYYQNCVNAEQLLGNTAAIRIDGEVSTNALKAIVSSLNRF